MTEIQTERLILRTNCTVTEGKLSFPDQPPFTSLLDIKPAKAEDSGFAICLNTGELIGHIGILFKRKPYELTIGIGTLGSDPFKELLITLQNYYATTLCVRIVVSEA